MCLVGRLLNFPGPGQKKNLKARWSRFKGVRWSAAVGKWQAREKRSGGSKPKHLGYFDSEEEVAKKCDEQSSSPDGSCGTILLSAAAEALVRLAMKDDGRGEDTSGKTELKREPVEDESEDLLLHFSVSEHLTSRFSSINPTAATPLSKKRSHLDDDSRNSRKQFKSRSGVTLESTNKKKVPNEPTVLLWV